MLPFACKPYFYVIYFFLEVRYENEFEEIQ